MDDKEFENRLNQLKTAYDNMPLESSPQKIYQTIVKTEPKRKRSLFMTLPFAASFAGAVIIAGMLGSYYLTGGMNQGTGPNTTAHHNIPPSNDEIKNEKNTVNNFYKKKAANLKKQLHFEEAEQYAFVQTGMASAERFLAKNSFMSKADLQKNKEKTTAEISTYVSMPAEQMAHFDQLKEKKKKIPDASFLAMLSKQKQLQERYLEEWIYYLENKQKNGMSTSNKQLLYKLNNKQQLGKEIDPLIQNVRKNGFIFYDSGEGSIEIQIDYESLKRKYSTQLSTAVTQYLEFKTLPKTMNDGSFAVAPDELKNRLLQFEEFILRNPNFEEVYEIKKLYLQTLQTYFSSATPAGISEKTINKEAKKSYETLLTEQKQTQTAQAVKPFYDKLKQNQFLTKPQPDVTKQPVPGFLGSVEYSEEPFYNLLPLTDHLLSLYSDIKASEKLSNVDYLPSPLGGSMDIPRIYLYALQKKDFATAYKLLSSEQRKTISQAEFKGRVSRSKIDYQEISNSAAAITSIPSKEGSELQLMLKSGEKIPFLMKYEGEFSVIQQIP